MEYIENWFEKANYLAVQKSVLCANNRFSFSISSSPTSSYTIKACNIILKTVSNTVTSKTKSSSGGSPYIMRKAKQTNFGNVNALKSQIKFVCKSIKLSPAKKTSDVVSRMWTSKKSVQ